MRGQHWGSWGLPARLYRAALPDADARSASRLSRFPPGRFSGCCRCSRPRCSGSCRCSSAGGRTRRCCCSEPPPPCCCRSSAGSPASNCSSKSPPGGPGSCAGGWGVPGVGGARADVGALCPEQFHQVSSVSPRPALARASPFPSAVGWGSRSLSGGAGRRMKGWRPSARMGGPQSPCSRWLTVSRPPAPGAASNSPALP